MNLSESSHPENANPSVKPKRRPRYRGTHPRRFHEKYKEHHPQKYPETIEKILASGKTPAGSHRPICVREIIEVLEPRAGQIAVDATLGHGGHAAELLRRLLPNGRLIGLDVDPLELPRTEARLREQGFPGEALTVCQSNFAGLPQVLARLGIAGVDLVVADLGCSSMQFDDPQRGFSFKREGPLDLRMNPQKGRPASAWLASLDEARLARLLVENADEPHAVELARAIIQVQHRTPLQTTSELAHVIRNVLSPREATAALPRVFQALRIAVNDEFSALETFLRFLPALLNPGARVAILSFHSGEDRRVKKAFEGGLAAGVYSRISSEVIRPSAEEVRANPRAASAKLRWAFSSGIVSFNSSS